MIDAMPLKQGKSRAVIEANIAELIAAGHEPDQAEAIAYRQAGLTRDRYTFADLQGVYAPVVLSANQSLTPEGFLLCRGVPIARTGQMMYGEGEVPVDARPDGLIVVSRDAEEVFRAETMASFEGKPVTLGHPDDFVTPGSWNQLAVGTVSNVRRGEGIEDDFLFADLLITAQQAIDEVQQGLREVSCGYEADYEQIEPGRGVQRNIVGNHVALVERGRCGPRCAIGDEDMTKKSSTKVKDAISALLRRAYRAKDANELEQIEQEAEAMDESPEEQEQENAAMKALLARIEALEKALAARAEAGDEDEPAAKPKKDDDDDGGETDDEGGDLTDPESAEKLSDADVALYTGDAAASIRSRAEILAPGLSLPTMDAKASTKDRALALCSCQRKALAAAAATDAGKSAIASILGSATHDFAKMAPGMVHATFMAASELVKQANNGSVRATPAATRDWGARGPTPAELNAANRAHWNANR